MNFIMSRCTISSNRHVYLSLLCATKRTHNPKRPIFNNCRYCLSTSAALKAPVLKFASVSSGNVRYKVGYDEDGPSDGQVIIALHGAPGASADFSALFEPLASAGYRVMAINFPGYGITTTEGNFPKGTDINAQLTLDLLQTLNITKVAAWMGHSAGTHVAFQLAAVSDLGQSVIALSSLGYLPQKAAKHLSIIRVLNRICHVPVVGIPFQKSLLYLFRSRGFRLESSGPLMTALSNISHGGYERMEGYGECIKQKNLPALFVCTKSDPIVQPEVPIKMARACGLSDEVFVEFDENRKHICGPDEPGHRRFLLFARGGHYAHRAHTDIVQRYIIGMLQGLPKQTDTRPA